MSTLELVLNMLAEATTTEISRNEEPVSFDENRHVAQRGGGVAGGAREAIEAQTGKPVITSRKAVDFSKLISDMVQGMESDDRKPE